MPLPKLSPLQSRLAASLIASVMLVLIYFAFMSPHFAYAADVDSIRPEDHNHERLLGGPLLDFDFEGLDLEAPTYEAQFVGVDRGIIGRATNEPTILINNGMQETNIPQGQLMSYMFSNASLWGPLSPINSGLPSQIILHGENKRSLDETDNLEDDQGNEDAEDAEDVGESRLRPRQSTSGNQRLLYITVTACKQPTSNTTTDPPPQLHLYISETQDNPTPGPGQNPQVEVQLDGGYALYEFNATGNIYIGVYGENVNTTYTGVWDAQIAASIDRPYHYFWNSTDPNLLLVDSDSNSALLYTDPLISDSSNKTLTEEWMNMTPPFTVFASDASDNSIMGLQNSYCGLQTKAQISASQPGQTTSDIATKMTDIGNGSLPKQQFRLTGLGPGKTYNIALAMNGTMSSGNSAVGAGGQVFKMTSFTTSSAVNCALITDLTFCDQTAYSVPTNPNVFNNTAALALWYDNSTAFAYTFFQKVLATQTPCNTTSSAQYSLARTCWDCENAYKAWLCAVMIPRCTDFNSTETWLQPRAMIQPFPDGTYLDTADIALANQSMALKGSRNPLIDTKITPGPYKELLPCEDLCYNLVQSCPASMQFGCPRPGVTGFKESYGFKPQGEADENGRYTNITCNYPGMVYYVAAGSSMAPSGVLLLISAILMLMMS
ncbi:hypothetical protein N431DRAFT_481771 [Stipitochalara longipes BDJ]|nr:hypothetical protein N431DRAFT_481771 [Stipitochalara longipes BDJ]